MTGVAIIERAPNFHSFEKTCLQLLVLLVQGGDAVEVQVGLFAQLLDLLGRQPQFIASLARLQLTSA